ncbi:Pol polyprotein, partial [Mucuna pruriens]
MPDSCRPYQCSSFYFTQPDFSLALLHLPMGTNSSWWLFDYFTKWVEATSNSTVTHNVVAKFIKRDIICRYGLPAHIITDNGTNLNNKMMTELCEQFKIRYHNFTPYRPKMNGAVEAANKNIKKIVQKMVVTYKD